MHKLSPQINVAYPIVTNLADQRLEKKINDEIITTLNTMLIEQGFYNENLIEMIGHYEIKTNERGILSLSLLVYSFTGGAHGLTIINSLTFDVNTGKKFTLKDLFQQDSDYVKVLSEIISKKMKEWDVPLLEEFNEIKANQDFYLADHNLVIYFQLYELTPYAYGFPYFPIALKEIESIIRPDSPLDKLIPF